MIGASAIGVFTVLVQADDEDQMQVIPYNSRIYTECEQKVCQYIW